MRSPHGSKVLAFPSLVTHDPIALPVGQTVVRVVVDRYSAKPTVAPPYDVIPRTLHEAAPSICGHQWVPCPPHCLSKVETGKYATDKCAFHMISVFSYSVIALVPKTIQIPA